MNLSLNFREEYNAPKLQDDHGPTNILDNTYKYQKINQSNFEVSILNVRMRMNNIILSIVTYVINSSELIHFNFIH